MKLYTIKNCDKCEKAVKLLPKSVDLVIDEKEVLEFARQNNIKEAPILDTGSVVFVGSGVLNYLKNLSGDVHE